MPWTLCPEPSALNPHPAVSQGTYSRERVTEAASNEVFCIRSAPSTGNADAGTDPDNGPHRFSPRVDKMQRPSR